MLEVLKESWVILGEFSSALSLIVFAISLPIYIVTIFLIWKGVFIVLYKMGVGLATKKIVILAKNDNLRSLESLLQNTKLFRKKNFSHNVSSVNDLDLLKGMDVFIVYWPDWKDNINDVLSRVEANTALIIYDPDKSIPSEQYNELSKKINTSVANFRGRLLNDLITSMITIN